MAKSNTKKAQKSKISEDAQELEYVRRRQLKDLIFKIGQVFLVNNGSLATDIGYTGSALSQIISSGGLRAVNEYIDRICKWLREKKQYEAKLNEKTNTYDLVEIVVEAKIETNFAEVTAPLDYEKFMDEVISLPNAAQNEVKIISTWLESLYGNDKNKKRLTQMIEASAKVRILVAKPESRFLEDRIRVLSNLAEEREEATLIQQVYKNLETLESHKRKFGAEKFDFRVYDTSSAIIMFNHLTKIYVTLLLGMNATQIFTSVYENNGSLHAQQLNDNFEFLWTNSMSYKKPITPLNMASIGVIAGTYKVYTYGHSNPNNIPSFIVGALKIAEDGAILQKTYASRAGETKIQMNEGWASRVGDRLFVNVFCSNIPINRGAYQFNIRDFPNEPGSLIVGVVATSTRNHNIPVALRIVLEKMPDNIVFEDMEVFKNPLSARINESIIHPTIHKFLSGIFRNMIRYHGAPIDSLESIEQEIQNQKAELGSIMYAYAKGCKDERLFQDSFRWAVTHGFNDFDLAKNDFGNINPSFLPYIIKMENLRN